MKSDFLIALTQLAAERHLPREIVLEAVEAAMASALKKEGVAAGQNIAVKLDTGTGEVKVFAVKKVVEAIQDNPNEILLADAKKHKKDAALGDTLSFDIKERISSRIAAQTAKQVVLQRLRDAEKELVFQEFVQRVDDLVPGVVDSFEFGKVIVNMGRAQGILPREEQVSTEHYRKGQRVQVLLKAVERTPRGPEITVSRAAPGVVKRLFEREVPEVFNGIVEVKGVAREAGSRSKVAVTARQDGVDPVGSCIGMRGNRIQNIVNELQGEKIDVVRWNKEPSAYIAKALSPAEVSHVELDEKTHAAIVVVGDKFLSAAIGRDGQNARLAAKLTGWRLDIKGATEWDEFVKKRQAEEEARRIAEREALAKQEAEKPRKVKKAKVEVAAEPEKVAAVARPVVVPPAREEEALAVVAEVRKPEVKVEPAPVAEEKVKVPAVALSAEEELAALTIEPEPEEAEEEEVAAVDIRNEEIWKVPAGMPDAGVIRFAEDILGSQEERGGRGGKRRRPEGKGRDKRGGRGGGRR